MDAGNISSGEQYLYANGDSTVPMGVVNPNGILYVTANSSSGSKYYDITNPSATWAAVIDQSKRRTISRWRSAMMRSALSPTLQMEQSSPTAIFSTSLPSTAAHGRH